MTPLFKDIAFVVYHVKDVKAARSFYEDVLGLTVATNWDDQWVEYDIGRGTLVITSESATQKAGVCGAILALEVVDFDRVLSHMRSQSVRIYQEPVDAPSCRSCGIHDADGNKIILHEKK